jgi:hypothetical protein
MHCARPFLKDSLKLLKKSGSKQMSSCLGHQKQYLHTDYHAPSHDTSPQAYSLRTFAGIARHKRNSTIMSIFRAFSGPFDMNKAPVSAATFYPTRYKTIQNNKLKTQ